MRFEEHILRELRDPEYSEAYEQLAANLQIASQVVAIRTALGLTQDELAGMVGTKQASVSRLENALGNPRLDFLRRVAKALGTRLGIRFEQYTALGPEEVFGVSTWQIAWWRPTVRSEVELRVPETWEGEEVSEGATAQLSFACEVR